MHSVPASIIASPRRRRVVFLVFVLFCALGHRSALATAQLMDMGFGPVCDIEGGFEAWRGAGGKIEEKS